MKKYTLFLIALIIFFTQISLAQNWRWARQFGNNCEDTVYAEGQNRVDGPTSMAIDGNGNSYLLTKLRSEKTIGDIKVDGISMGKGYGGTNDIGIISFDSNGRHRWTKLIGSKGLDFGSDLKIDSLGGVYVTANISPYYNDTLKMSTDTSIVLALYGKWCVFKYDTAGNFKWIRFIEPKTGTSDISWAEGMSLAVSPKGDLSVAGYTNMSGAFADGLYNIPSTATLPGIYVFKYDLNGKFINAFPLDISELYNSAISQIKMCWDYRADVYYFVYQNFFRSMDWKAVKFGKVTLTGSNTLSKFSNTGKLIWLHQSTTTNGAATSPSSPVFDKNGNVYVLFADSVGSNFIGYYNENTDRNGLYIAKVAPSGTLVWGKSFKGYYFYGANLAMSNSNILGVKSHLGFGFSNPLDNFIEVDSFKIFLSKPKKAYSVVLNINSATSKVLFFDTLLTNLTVPYSGLAFDNKNNFYVAGSFIGKLAINGLPAINSYSGTIDGYIARYSPYVTTSIPSIKPSMLKVYPNPTNSFVNIEAVEIGSEITLYNTVGVLLAKQIAITNQLQVPLTDLADGIYLLKIKNATGQLQTHKIVKY